MFGESRSGAGHTHAPGSMEAASIDTGSKVVTFTDGTPVDAQAVSDNFEYWTSGGNGTVQAYIQEYYESSKAVDASTTWVVMPPPADA